ncbi:predicted protein [Pyrenophora tritici-repentis Pt-1C-BFP]|uniref:Uncharacterized protein n=1 Tax=Pyrenophora tritici-repentis (strain Pt-1C-BFP) TaxID=426418 RepID=B2W1E5_PYRTR|nr:uncharacterized protein PTRG_04280 [Pyrenophora tritici-repentis Pt-1C-BFP]EDU47118.1 predicted protein [Pyrenophora tritici-repentis Pt-1C-BFP]
MAQDKRAVCNNPSVLAEEHIFDTVDHKLFPINWVEQIINQSTKQRKCNLEKALYITTARLDGRSVITYELEWAKQVALEEEELAIMEMVGIVEKDDKNAKWKARWKEFRMPETSRQKGTEPHQATSFKDKEKKQARDPELEPQQANQFKGKGKGKGKEPAEAPSPLPDLNPSIKWPHKHTIAKNALDRARKPESNCQIVMGYQRRG